MKIIKSSVKFYGTVPTDYEGALKFIEMAGRTCYKSEDKITETSAEGFVKRLIKAGHLAMVEHSNFVVRFKITNEDYIPVIIAQAGKYLNFIGSEKEMTLCVGGSLTAWFNQYVEVCERLTDAYPDISMFDQFRKVYADLFDPMVGRHLLSKSDWEVCPHDEIPKELHRYSAKFICDRGVTHELVRHRPCSFAQESTRYVNYGDKDMEFIEPDGFDDWPEVGYEPFFSTCIQAERDYGLMLRAGLKPQQARAVLPNALKTEIVVTADAAEWLHIKKLRTDKAAHPDIQRVMNMIPWNSMED